MASRDAAIDLSTWSTAAQHARGKWNRVREELIQSLDELKPDQWFYVILFDGQTHPMFGPGNVEEEMLPATSDNIARARRWVMGYQSAANTSPLASVVHAMESEAACRVPFDGRRIFRSDGPMAARPQPRQANR